MMLEARARPAKHKEAEAILRFYKSQNDPYVLPRPLKDLQDSAEKGLFFVVEIESRLVAVSGVFDLGDIPFVELGGTLADKSVRGFGLQTVFFGLRIASVVVHQGLDIRMLTAIDPTNKPSRRNTLDSGFIIWPDPIPELFEPCVACNKRDSAVSVGRQCCCEFYELPQENARSEVKQLLADVNHAHKINRVRPKTGETLTVTVESQLLTAHRTVLEDFASGKSW